MSVTKLGGHGSLLAKLVQPAQEVVDDENQLGYKSSWLIRE